MSSMKIRHSLGVLLLRLLVGWVFATEGIQKFLYPATLGAGRFEKIGIPAPYFLAPFVGAIEIIFGVLLILGLWTALATIPLIINISVAIFTTKVPIFMQHGFWVAIHEGRTDLCMLLGLIAIILLGTGSISLDAWRNRSR